MERRSDMGTGDLVRGRRFGEEEDVRVFRRYRLRLGHREAHGEGRAVIDLGVNSFVSKPVTFDELASAMQRLACYWFDLVELPQESGDEHH